MPSAVSARGRGLIKTDRKKSVLVMRGKGLDVGRVRLKQGCDHRVARSADIEPENFGRSLLQHAHSDEVFVSGGQNESAGAREVPEQAVGRASLGEIADVLRP